MSGTDADGLGTASEDGVEEYDELDDFEVEGFIVERQADPTSMAAYVLAFLALGGALFQGLIQLLQDDGSGSFVGAALVDGISASGAGVVGVLAVALAGLSRVRARAGVPVDLRVARTAVYVGVAAVIVSLVVLVVQVQAIDNSPLFQDNGSGFSVP